MKENDLKTLLKYVDWVAIKTALTCTVIIFTDLPLQSRLVISLILLLEMLDLNIINKLFK